MSFLQQLNSRQKEAVLTKSRYVRIIAGAGSGKTRVLTTRIVHLIEDLGVAANSIVAITFTNKAANEMKDRRRNHPCHSALVALGTDRWVLWIVFLHRDLDHQLLPTAIALIVVLRHLSTSSTPFL